MATKITRIAPGVSGLDLAHKDCIGPCIKDWWKEEGESCDGARSRLASENGGRVPSNALLTR